ncbi:MAG TPA: prepilin-type N-terminal cleavage/methylation domain-containing protein [Pseudolysinimonas sp.]|nr:prepilin-type N-terminal cleavage/methylation domain-containing protein [Pseudolysinimonas sp.]
MDRHRIEKPRSALSTPRDDDGFTLIEPVIAMFLLALIALALLPLLTQSLVQSVNNAVLVTATSLANQAIEDERSKTTCAGLTPLDQTTVVRPDVTLRTVRTVAACPASFPSTVKVSVTVTDTATGSVKVSAATMVFVTGV